MRRTGRRFIPSDSYCLRITEPQMMVIMGIVLVLVLVLVLIEVKYISEHFRGIWYSNILKYTIYM